MMNRAHPIFVNVLYLQPIETTLTTRGYLSDGCPPDRPLSINGVYGPDFFDVLRNRCVLDLNGESGDDSFTVRSFLLARRIDTDDWGYDTENITLSGGFSINNSTNSSGALEDGNDSFVVENPEELPDYVVNSLVDIDGGTGTNRLTIVGTEEGDRYVIQDGKIFGGGL